MKQWEDYLQPNGTLRNLLGIMDDEELHQLEYDYTVDRSQKLILAKYKLPDGQQLTGQQVGGLKLINGYLFGKVYDWAGHYREVDFNKTANGVVTFFHPVALFGNAEMDIQRQLDNFAMLPNDREQLAQALGQVVTEINMFHPFREGNGRTTRLFTEVLAWQHGFDINYTQAQQDAYMQASIQDDAEMMAQVFLEVLTK
ncbi:MULTISPECIES: Fic/DOC family protein [Lactobacillaceae]|uniref:Fic/DOC family protein n=1 Tax=Lactobacillaceae TaxID=33958 RepID=UPI0007622360|nr:MULTISPECIES: Fic family protein [Lactobacillaceae]KWU39356.1 cell filamentation protein Fic [Levilactobacillus brevis]MBT9671069.1 cell filamentation protein Fic [Secundilactobacillus kimchicus]MBT9678282.1 cell filamentation protein Fic [Levilactobacillus brevis]MCS6164682.1 cell filamentation protein Fic [Levilactobacillus brevis]MCT3574905.1 cell filamentation protein Fic [Levilactobacillus brevis]